MEKEQAFSDAKNELSRETWFHHKNHERKHKVATTFFDKVKTQSSHKVISICCFLQTFSVKFFHKLFLSFSFR